MNLYEVGKEIQDKIKLQILQFLQHQNMILNIHI